MVRNYGTVPWKRGSLIRHIHTKKAMLVLNVAQRVGTFVVDPTDSNDTLLPQVILQRDYSKWDLDTKFDSNGDQFFYRPSRMVL